MASFLPSATFRGKVTAISGPQDGYGKHIVLVEQHDHLRKFSPITISFELHGKTEHIPAEFLTYGQKLEVCVRSVSLEGTQEKETSDYQNTCSSSHQEQGSVSSCLSGQDALALQTIKDHLTYHGILFHPVREWQNDALTCFSFHQLQPHLDEEQRYRVFCATPSRDVPGAFQVFERKATV